MPRNIDPFDELLETWPAKLRDAFLESISGITSRAKIREIVRLLERGDIEGVLRHLDINPLEFQGLSLAMRDLYTAGGLKFGQAIPTLVRFIFDVRNPTAEEWLRFKSSELVTEIVEDQRNMVRGFLTEGLERGDNPTTTARNLVGRIEKTSGQRTGGVLGLTSGQERWQQAYAAEIASSDPSELRKALGRNLRDKRFDRSITKAIREGTGIPKAIQGKMLRAYRNRTLKYRANTIGRTETLQSLAASQYEAYRQAILTGELTADQVTKEWDSAGDLRVRFSHNVLDGQKKGFFEAFVSPLGNRMEFPGDTSHGARGEDIIQCRCRLKYKLRFR